MAVTGPLVSPVLVGRDDLLELADRRLRAGLGGRGHLLFLAGEAGIGKSRLLGSVERRAASLGYRTARGGTYPGDLEVAGAVFLDLARALGRSGAFGDLGDRLTARLTEPDGAGPGDVHRRRRLLTLDVSGLLAEAASGGPAVLALEDLHQSDDLTLEILAGLARLLPDLPLVVVATYRSDELFPRVPLREWRSRLLAQRLAEEARLRRLTREETGIMATLLLDSGQAAPVDLVRAVHDRTDGIPLHIEELLVHAGEGTAALEDEAVPDTLEAAILGRIERRSDRARDVANVGAVIGRSFELDLLASVVGDDPEDLARPLTELADHFLLAPSPASGRYGFRHALICDAIYGRIPPVTRQRLHAQIARVAAARGDFSDAFLSSHCERGGLRAEAFDRALRAARAADAISARREALDLYARAIRNAPPDLDPADRGALYRSYADAAAAADDTATAGAAYERAHDELVRAGRTAEAAAVVARLVAVRHLLGDGLEAREARLRKALEALEALEPPDAGSADGAAPGVAAARARLVAEMAAANMLDRRLDPAIAHAEVARALAAEAGDEAVQRHASVTLGASLVFEGRMDEGWTLLEESVRAAREDRLESEAARAYRMIGSSASVLVEYPRAEAWLREGVDYAERVERWNDRHYMAAHLAHVLWATGRWSEAAAVAGQALADGRGGITTRITALHVLGYVALGRGDWAAAEAALDEARAAGARMGELQRLAPALWGLAETALLRGDAAAALDWAERGRLASCTVDDAAYLFPFVVTGTRAHLALGDPAAAGRWLAAVEPPLRRRGIPGTLAALDHAEGLVLVATGSLGRARESLAAAGAAWIERGRWWEGTWARVDLARALVRANRHAEALGELTAAEASARAVGAEPIVERAQAIGRSGRARNAGAEPWRPLTSREYEVARLVAEGLTNHDIAERIGVAPKTVGSHVEHILAKLGAGRRAEIAAWAVTVQAASEAGARRS